MSGRQQVFQRGVEQDAVAFRLQRGFRALLDAMARPGELADLGPASPEALDAARMTGLLPQTVHVLDVVLDSGTTVAAAGEGGERLARALSQRTHARTAPVHEAAFCVVPLGATGREAADAVARLAAGTLESPHLGATCVVECATLLGRGRTGARTGSASGAAPRCRWSLEGPGIEGAELLECDRSDAIDARVSRADEFPLGIDLVLVDGAGHVACLPRSARVTREGNGTGGSQWDM